MEGERLRGGGRGEKLFYRLPASLHMLLLYKGCLESQRAAQIQMPQANTQMHARAHIQTQPKELQKREVPLERRKPIIKISIQKQRLPSEINFNYWGRRGMGDVF